MKRQLGVGICAVMLGLGSMVACSGSSGDQADSGGTAAGDTIAADDGTSTSIAPEDSTTDDSLTRDEFIAELTQDGEGMPVEIATCIADALEDAGIAVNRTEVPSDEVRERANALAETCMVQDVDGASTP